MTIDVSFLLITSLKSIFFCVAEVFIFMIICWPIEDKKISRFQWKIFSIVSFLFFEALFLDFIHYR